MLFVFSHEIKEKNKLKKYYEWGNTHGGNYNYQLPDIVIYLMNYKNDWITKHSIPIS